MICTIEVEYNGIPYTQITFGPSEDDESVFITFRRYARRVFVGVEDYRFETDQPPCFIIEKTDFSQFDAHKAFFRALHFLNLIDDMSDKEMNDWIREVWEQEYEELEPMVEKWEGTPVPTI